MGLSIDDMIYTFHFKNDEVIMKQDCSEVTEFMTRKLSTVHDD